MNKTINKIRELLNELESEPVSKLQLEDHNFRVDSTGWKKVTVNDKSYLENDKKDIWELLDKDYLGEQLFTWDSAIRETKKAGKRMPTEEEFEEMLKDKDFPKNRVLAGYRYCNDASLGNVGAYGGYWSSSVSDSGASNLYFDSGSAGVYANGRASGFSVRCLREL